VVDPLLRILAGSASRRGSGEKWDELRRMVRRLIEDAKYIHDSLWEAYKAIMERNAGAVVDELADARAWALDLTPDTEKALDLAYEIWEEEKGE